MLTPTIQTRGATGAKVINMPRMGRVMRRPRERFQIRSRPFEITPFMIHPVLPAETLKSLQMQSRVLTDPIDNQLIGWWKEYFFFYVKHSDLPGRDDFTAMHLDPSTSLASYEQATADDPWHYAAQDDINWSLQCLKQVTEHWFRNDGELWDDYVGDAAHPLAKIKDIGWLDSAVDSDALATAADETVVNEAGTDTIEASEIDAALRRYEFLKMNHLTEAATYEDYLASFGVRAQPEVIHKPELLRMITEWSLPSSAVDGSGNVSTVVSWNITGRADKDRFFREPGFIYGVTVTRPKVYLENVKGSMVGIMRDAYSWLPAIMRDDPSTSLVNVTAGEGPLDNQTSDYVVDIKDKLIHGDQFVNFALTATDAHLCPVPADGLANKEYPTSAFIDELFTGVDPANQVREDGIVSLHIAGAQTETS